MELIRYTDKFDDPRLPGVTHVTIKLRPVSSGTEIEQFGIPEKCYLGWQQSLAQLAQLVELEIPGSDGGDVCSGSAARLVSMVVADGPPNELPIRGTNRESSAAPLIAFPQGSFPTVGLGAIAEIGIRPERQSRR